MISATAGLAQSQVAAWNLVADTAPLFLSAAALILIFGLLLIIQRRFLWHDDA